MSARTARPAAEPGATRPCCGCHECQTQLPHRIYQPEPLPHEGYPVGTMADFGAAMVAWEADRDMVLAAARAVDVWAAGFARSILGPTWGS